MNNRFTMKFLPCPPGALISERVKLPAGILLFFLLAANTASAQQEIQHTQFMFNKLAYNPGYAGSYESSELLAIYRNQWMGIDGAPKTQILSYNQPLVNQRLGIGINLSRTSIAITTTTTVDLVYCYRIRMSRGDLGIGVMPNVRNFAQNWADTRLYSPTPAGTDVAIPQEARNKWVVNFGAGAYFSNQKWYAGVSVPRIFPQNIDFSQLGDDISREALHLNLMAGFMIKAGEQLAITPQLLLKYVPHAPFDADVNVTALLRNRFYGGLSYCIGGDNTAGESLNVLAGVQATTNLFFCLSYDIGLTALRRVNNGSIEATARWYFNPPEGILEGDRDF